MSTSRAGAGKGLPPGVTNVLVLGAGRSGRAAAKALACLGMMVRLSDIKAAEALPELTEIEAAGIAFITQEKLASAWPPVDLVIRSPGIPGQAAPLVVARERGIPVWSEIELAYALFSNPFSAVTGTNGKTTTAALLGHLLATAGRPSRVLGNIGTAVTSLVGTIQPEEELVVEVSSFQLEDVHAFCPAVGIFLNLTPDHLDRHGTMKEYLRCKANLFAQQGPGEVAVLNLDDPAIRRLGKGLQAKAEGPRVLYFSTAATVSTAVAESAQTKGPDFSSAGERPVSWLAGDHLFLAGQPVVRIDELQLVGRHNLENYLAASTAALARGASEEAVAEGLRTFSGVPHRLEKAGMIGGVTYVNDSKATNVDAVLTALSAYPKNTHLILGGRDKASDYRPLARACIRGCKAVYLIGEAASLIAEAFAQVESENEGQHFPGLQMCGDLENAVRAAARAAAPGDVVLLAPACASFDQYSGFEERGDHFRQIVAALSREALV